ncbi:hypothetical protein FSARC_8506 [Fusarium sarcochroum]|uniref:Major facilitator superfamily (MFS) profile domain-containing protein n=1 Tax=Fusarium sarcochroum TaxID=1208366 RepID=A0A8H4X686_9HYPO|nr:hypothetical protein FSARC_8506 [Fusarium sarcochroum]
MSVENIPVDANLTDSGSTDTEKDCQTGYPDTVIPKVSSVEFDNPRGWIPVAAAACSLFVYLGVIYSWGIMQVRLVETTSSSLTTLTFVGSLGTSFMISLSILSGIAVRKLGYQKTALTGAVLMGLGEFLASWTTKHIAALFVFHGVVFGIGGGLSIFVSTTFVSSSHYLTDQACSTAPLRWFQKHRGLAMGVVFGGGSLGAAVMSIATHLLVRDVDVAWTFRILGFMLWGVCVPASYFIQQPQGSANANLELQWYRFKDSRFLLVVAGTAVSCFPLFIPPYFIPIFSRSMGYSDQIAIVILAAWNLASTVGRVLGGYTADVLLGPLNSLIVCLLFIGLSSLVVWPLASSVGIFSVFLVFNGIGCGAFFSLVPPMIGATMGPENTLGILPIVWTTWFCGFFFSTRGPAVRNAGTVDPESDPVPTEETGLLPNEAIKSSQHDVAKIIAVNAAMLLAGMNDAATGALIPYIQSGYDVGLLSVAILYLVNFSGWLLAAFTNVHVASRFGMGGALVIGGSLQFIAYALNFWKPPFIIFNISFFFSGLGVACLDAQANTYVAHMRNSHRWLGVLHAIYGLGALISPIAATTLGTKTPYWHYFYLMMVVITMINIAILSFSFREGLFKRLEDVSDGEASDQLRRALSQKCVWMMSIFFFLYVGAEVTSGGWVIEFLIAVRNSPPDVAGYVASAYWGGLMLGRILLADITHKLGDRRMVFLYILIGLGLQLIFWFVRNVAVDAIAVSLLGFVIAPLFPVGLSVVTHLLPRDLHVAAIGFTATVGQAGSAAFPFLTGAVASKAGVIVLQPIMVGLLLGMFVIWGLVPGVKKN